MEMDTNLDNLLGSNPDGSGAVGPPLNEQIWARWSSYITKGLDKDQLKELHQKYLLPSNADLLQAPQVNPEVHILLSNEQRNTDNYLSKIQNHLGKSLASLSQVLNELIDKPEKSDETKILVDTAKLMAESIHGLSIHRRFLLSPKLSLSAKKVAQECPSGNLLFGNDFQEKCKAAKEVEKTSKEIKVFPSISLNYKQRNFKTRKKESTSNRPGWKRRPQTIQRERRHRKD